ncbi:MAG TPA: class I SAM-dependent methyltransferase [Vicinamibacterales bacterium]
MSTVGSGTRAERIAALAFDYDAQPKIGVRQCNLCGGSEFVGLVHRDRYGYRAAAVCCSGCGLVFLDPVMTPEAYGTFYESTYRPLVSAYHGRLIDARTVQQEQREYAVERGHLLEPLVAGRGYRTILDIGGSTGVVAHEFAQRFNLRATVVDPSPLETAQAQALGLETIEGLVEHVDLAERRFDIVMLCQTVDHLLDISGTLRRIRDLLRAEGVLFLDIVDLRAAYLRNWSIEEAIKIDHPYYLTEATTTAYLRRTGFEVIRVDYAGDHLHISYVGRPSRPDATALPSQESVRELLREVRFLQNAPHP